MAVVESSVGILVAFAIAFFFCPALAGFALLYAPLKISATLFHERLKTEEFISKMGQETSSMASKEAKAMHDCLSHVKTAKAMQCEQNLMARLREIVRAQAAQSFRMKVKLAAAEAIDMQLGFTGHAFLFL